MTAEERIVSIIIPAFNESGYLPGAISALRLSADSMKNSERPVLEFIVVNDQSTDETPAIAERLADLVVNTSKRSGIGFARNTGANYANGALLVFVDADTIVPLTFLSEVWAAYNQGVLIGAVPGSYTATSLGMRILFKWWAWYGPRHQMTQGVCQFFDRAFFRQLGGYDDSLQMAEDTDIYHRGLDRLGPEKTTRARVIGSLRVEPSMRRYEACGTFRAWLWTNPLTTKLFRRSNRFWKHWYDNPPR